MLKRFGFIMTAALCATLFSSSAYALDLDESTRSVPLDQSGTTVILTPEQVKRGKRLFNSSCGNCHVGGITKTLNEGELWWFDNKKVHSVKNLLDKPRICVIFDVLHGSSWRDKKLLASS